MTDPGPPPFRLFSFETLDSTNDEATRMARAGAPAWTVVWAREQTAGRGRRQRTWASPPGNLYLSIVLRPPGPLAAAAQLGFAAALAVGEVLAPLLPGAADLRYKWPNDVMVDGRKIAGILLESEAAADGSADWVVAGIGVNLAAHPTDCRDAAGSLAGLGVKAPPLETVRDDLTRAFARWEERWRREGFQPLRRAWLKRALGLGGSVGVRLERESFTGRFVDLDRDGALLIETETGRRRVPAGEIFPAAA